MLPCFPSPSPNPSPDPNPDPNPDPIPNPNPNQVAAMGEACASGKGQPGQPAAPVARVRATSLARHQLGRFLVLLAPRGKQQPADGNEWMLDRWP